MSNQERLPVDVAPATVAGEALAATVRRLPRSMTRPCARPGCSVPAGATLTFDYQGRRASVASLAPEPEPQAYDLCPRHAGTTRPPRGWRLDDTRPEDGTPPTAPHTPAALGGDRTVAVLAAALRAVPDPVSEDALEVTAGTGSAPTGGAEQSALRLDVGRSSAMPARARTRATEGEPPPARDW